MFSVTGDVQYNKVANHDTLIQAIVTSLTHYSTEYCSALRAQSSEMWESTEAIDQAVDFSSTSANGVGQVQYLTMVIDNISWYEGIWRRDDSLNEGVVICDFVVLYIASDGKQYLR